MRLPEQMGLKLGSNPVPLEPFGHQVAGQASMLSVDWKTVCKPLIPREHHLYDTLPPQLLPFTPQYKGVLYVRLEEEEDGRLTLWGYPPDDGIHRPEDNSHYRRGGPDHHDNDNNDDDDDGRASSEALADEDRLDWSSGASTPLSSSSEMDMLSAVDFDHSVARSRPPSGCVVRIRQDGVYEVKASTKADMRFLIGTEEDALSPPGKGLNRAEAQTQPLNPWGLNLHTRLLDKMRKSQPSVSGCPFLVLENVVARFSRPCILDLKVGSRLHGDGASQGKIASQSHKCNITTSRTLGLRLCGMQVYQETTGTYKSHDKYYGRTLTDKTFYYVLRDFLHNGCRLRAELLSPILARLNALLSCLQRLNSCRFYASSLLIMYDGQTMHSECNFANDSQGKATPGRQDLDVNRTPGESCSVPEIERRLQRLAPVTSTTPSSRMFSAARSQSLPTGSVELIGSHEGSNSRLTDCYGQCCSHSSKRCSGGNESKLSSARKCPESGSGKCLSGSGKCGVHNKPGKSSSVEDGTWGSDRGGSVRTINGNVSDTKLRAGCADGKCNDNVSSDRQLSNLFPGGQCGSSLGNSPGLPSRQLNSAVVNGHSQASGVDVRMIDFAHTTHSGFDKDEVTHEGPDTDYLWGLQNLIDLFSQLQADDT